MSIRKIEVKRVESEGEFHLMSVECIKLDRLKVWLNLLSVIMTCGGWLVVGTILGSWNIQLVRQLLYSPESIQQCSHFYVKNNHGQYSITKK